MDKTNLGRRDFFKLIGGALGLGALSYYFGLRSQPRRIPSEQLPDYIDAGSAFPVFRGPYLQKDAQLAAFLFPADLSALSALCNQSLNAAADTPFEYVPLLSSVLVVYADMLVSSLDERDSQVGLIPETELGFWLPTVAMQKTAAGSLPHHLAWFIPYLLVDEGNAIATGREVYGFNKQAASFNKAGNIQAPNFSAEVMGFEQFGPTALAQRQPLLEITTANAPASQGQWPDWESAQSSLSDMFLAETRNDLDDGILTLAAQTALQNIPLVFLKQFRDARHAQKACYQAVVEAPLQIEAFHGGGFFSQPAELSLRTLASHPLMRMLGLKENQATGMGAWLKVDFTLGLGTELAVG